MANVMPFSFTDEQAEAVQRDRQSRGLAAVRDAVRENLAKNQERMNIEDLADARLREKRGHVQALVALNAALEKCFAANVGNTEAGSKAEIRA